MEIKRIIDLLKAERECVNRNSHGTNCDRHCEKCELVQKDDELIEMYDFLLSMMEMKSNR